MKILFPFRGFLILISLFSLYQTVNSQDYRAVRNDAEYYFLDSLNSNIIALRIDSVSSTGNQTDYYGFRQLRQTDYGCFTMNGASWIGDVVTEKADGTFIFTVYPFSPSDSANTFRIVTLKTLNQSWNFYNYHSINHHIEAKILDHILMSFIGLSDSVKVISLTRKDAAGQVIADPVNSQKILLSKHFGLIRLPAFDVFPYNQLFYSIIGRNNPDTGITNLNTLKIFDFQPGDELHSVWHEQGSPVPYTIMDGAVIQRILERIPSSANDSVTYRIEECRSSLYQFSATEHLYSHSTDTVYRIYSTAGSKLESLPLEPINLPDGSATYGFMGFLTDASIPVYDRPAKFFPNHMIWTHQDECYTMITYDGCWYDEIYLEGLGGPYHNCTDFGWGPSYNLLKYYKKGNMSWGTPLQCDSLLHVGIQESALAESFTLTPNPSHGLLTLCFPSGFQRGMLSLYDLSGRKVVNTPIINNNQTVDISELPAGLYVYRFRIASGKEMHGKIIKQ